MTTAEYLSRAPITEAVIEIRVQPRDGLDDRAPLRDAHRLLKERYPDIESVGPENIADGAGEGGVLFRSGNGLEIAQFLRSGFSFNRLKPYTKWEEVFPEAFRVWNIYRETTSPALVTRIGVRYINRLPLPLPVREISDYLTAPPHIPQGLPTTMSAFLTFVALSDPSNRQEASITQALEAVDAADATVILDIETRVVGEFAVDDPAIQERFESLREFKNRIFFQSITDQTKALFK